MAANGTRDHHESFHETLRRVNDKMDTTDNNIIRIEREIEEMGGILMVIEEDFKNPLDVGTTEEQLAESEHIVLPAYREVHRMHDTLQNMVDTLKRFQYDMKEFSNELSYLEQEQRVEGEKLRLDIEEKQYEMGTTASGMPSTQGYLQAMIESLTRHLQRTETNQELVHDLHENYKEVEKKIDRISKARDNNFGRVMGVIPTLKRQLDSIAEQRKRISGRRAGSSLLSNITEVALEEEGNGTMMEMEDDVKMSEKGEASEQGEKREAKEENMEIEESPKKKRRS